MQNSAIHVQLDLHCPTCSYQVLRQQIVELEAKVQKKRMQLKEAATAVALPKADKGAGKQGAKEEKEKKQQKNPKRKDPKPPEEDTQKKAKTIWEQGACTKTESAESTPSGT